MIKSGYTVDQLYLVWQRARGMLMSVQEGLIFSYELNSYWISKEKIGISENIGLISSANSYVEIKI